MGFVGSAARHYELGPIGLALVKRTTPVAATLLAGGLPAAQEVIVPPDAGANVKVTLQAAAGIAPLRDLEERTCYGTCCWPRRTVTGRAS